MKYKIFLYIGDRFCGPVLNRDGEIFYAPSVEIAETVGAGALIRLRDIGVTGFSIEEIKEQRKAA